MDSSAEKFKFPECWNNDVRMNALFAPFRPKSINPTDWNSKMNFWISLIESWCKFHKCPVVEISSLKHNFSRKGLAPVCLEEVLQNMYSTKIVINKEDFMASNDSWKAWAVKVLVTNPLKWTFNTVKDAIIKSEQKEISYLHLPVIKFLGESLVKSIFSSHQGKLISLDELLHYGFDNPENLSLVLLWLQKQGMIVIHEENELKLVKFSKNSKNGVQITETDIGIYSLERQHKLLEDNIKKLETEKMAALEETKKHLAAKMKNMAKISLRRKNAIEKTIEKRTVMLDNIQEILYKIDQAKLDSEVIKCYQKGITTMKEIFNDFGLSGDTVLETMNELKEVLNSRNEIEQSISQPMDSGLDDLEDELNELLLSEAPEVPANNLPTPDKQISKDTKNLPAKMEALSIS